MIYKIICAYDGTRYQGWQKNTNAKDTIQQKLEFHISQILGEDIILHGSGRTDKGVHALNQVAHFESKKNLGQGFVRNMNKDLPDDIIIKSIEEMDKNFHARLSASEKTYEYTIWKVNCKEPPLFERKYVYHLDEHVVTHINKKSKGTLDVEIMRQAANLFIGEHDFKGFSSDKTKKSTVRVLNTITLTEDENTIKVSMSGNGFLYNMVRIIVGTLIEIGLGARSMESITDIFDSKDRNKAGYTVPADGLCLMDVTYS